MSWKPGPTVVYVTVSEREFVRVHSSERVSVCVRERDRKTERTLLAPTLLACTPGELSQQSLSHTRRVRVCSLPPSQAFQKQVNVLYIPRMNNSGSLTAPHAYTQLELETFGAPPPDAGVGNEGYFIHLRPPPAMRATIPSII